MSQTINKLQVRQAKFNSKTMIDLNHWSTNLALKPDKFLSAHRFLFASRTNTLPFSKGNILEGIFGLGKTKEIDNLNWSWEVSVDGFRPLTILQNRTPGNTPGKGRQPIVLLMDSDIGQVGDQWSSGSVDKSQVLTITNIVKEGRGFVYTMKTHTEEDNHFIRPKFLKAGSKWVRLSSMRGEAAETGGGFESSTKIEYKNSLVKLRKQYKVTDYGAQAPVLEIAFSDREGNVYSSWMDKQEAECYMAMNKELAYHAMYSRLTSQPLIDPDSKYPINPGAGLQQQISFGGNIERYDELSAELIEAFFNKIVYSRIAPGDLGEVIGFSGQYGMQAFAKALDVWSGKRSILRESSDFISKDPTGYNKNSLTTGYTFTKYNLPTGGTFKLIHNPMYDDRSINTEVEPGTNIPLESQRITILDITGGNNQSINGKDNIHLVRKKNVYKNSIVKGTVGPGGIPNPNPAHGGEYYEVHLVDSVGIQVTDPTVTGELIKTVGGE